MGEQTSFSHKKILKPYLLLPLLRIVKIFYSSEAANILKSCYLQYSK